MKSQQISGVTLLQFIRVLAELRAAGLTKDQINFLGESAELSTEDVNSILEAADSAYETIKDLLAEGCQILPQGTVLSQKELKAACTNNDRIVKAIVFAGDNQLNLDEYSEDNNSLFEKLLVGSQISVGETAGLEYKCLFSELPFFVEADIPEDTCCQYLESNEQQ